MRLSITLALAAVATAAVCPSGTNCFDGTYGSTWRGSPSFWTMLHFPSYPELTQIDTDATLRSPSNGAAKQVSVALPRWDPSEQSTSMESSAGDAVGLVLPVLGLGGR